MDGFHYVRSRLGTCAKVLVEDHPEGDIPLRTHSEHKWHRPALAGDTFNQDNPAIEIELPGKMSFLLDFHEFMQGGGLMG
jgi:hypothetical protein